MRMRTYSSHSSFQPAGKRGKSFRWLIIGLVFGFVGGVATATGVIIRKPVEFVISMPRQDFPAEDLSGSAQPEVWSDSGNVSVRTPRANTAVVSPLIVEGMERTFEQNVVLRLSDGKGVEMVKVAVTGTAPDAGIHGPYRAELKFEKPKTKTGTLEVFQGSAKDGSEIDKVTIPLRFLATGESASGGE